VTDAFWLGLKSLDITVDIEHLVHTAQRLDVGISFEPVSEQCFTSPPTRERTIHEKPDRPRFSICNQREIGGSEPVFSS